MQSASPPLHLLFIHTRIESIPPTLPFRASIQQQVRDAICKALYSRLWQSVIRSLNQYLDVSNDKAGVESMGLHFIGLLDFAGFEHFFEHSNGFEQLLINYANEMLQWHFNCFIFEVGTYFSTRCCCFID